MRFTCYAAGLITLAACQHARAAGPEPERPGAHRTGVQTTGVGTHGATPDLAVLTLGVSVERASSAARARTEAAEAMSALMKALRRLDVPERDIQTSSIRIDAEYRFDDRVRRLVGYRADERVEVRLRKLDRIGQVIDEALSAVGDRGRLDGLRFALEDPAAAQSKARAAAVAAARRSAEELAKALGLELGSAVEVVELLGAAGRPPQPGNGANQLRAMAEASTPVSAGTLDVRVAVRVRFALVP